MFIAASKQVFVKRPSWEAQKLRSATTVPSGSGPLAAASKQSRKMTAKITIGAKAVNFRATPRPPLPAAGGVLAGWPWQDSNDITTDGGKVGRSKGVFRGRWDPWDYGFFFFFFFFFWVTAIHILIVFFVVYLQTPIHKPPQLKCHHRHRKRTRTMRGWRPGRHRPRLLHRRFPRRPPLPHPRCLDAVIIRGWRRVSDRGVTRGNANNAMKFDRAHCRTYPSQSRRKTAWQW